MQNQDTMKKTALVDVFSKDVLEFGQEIKTKLQILATRHALV